MLKQPEGGFVLWVELNKEVNACQLYQQAIKYNISITLEQTFSELIMQTV